jgi:hypothetical protein
LPVFAFEIRLRLGKCVLRIPFDCNIVPVEHMPGFISRHLVVGQDNRIS